MEELESREKQNVNISLSCRCLIRPKASHDYLTERNHQSRINRYQSANNNAIGLGRRDGYKDTDTGGDERPKVYT